MKRIAVIGVTAAMMLNFSGATAYAMAKAVPVPEPVAVNAVSTADGIQAPVGDKQQLEALITFAKSRVDVPADYTEFSSSYSQWSDQVGVWSFTWSTKPLASSDGNAPAPYARPAGGNISVSVTTDKHITWYSHDTHSYYYYYEDSRVKSFPKITSDEAKSIATAFVQKIAPEYYGDLMVDDIQTADNVLANNQYYITIGRVVNGVKLPYGGVSVNIDSTTGGVTNFYSSYDYTGVFAKTDGVINAQQAATAYNKAYPLRLVYVEDVDGLRLVYTPEAAAGDYIDAKTGEPTSTGSYGMPYYPMMGAGMARSEAAMDAGGLSPQEQAVAENMDGLMSVDDAMAILHSMKLAGVDERYNVSSSVSYNYNGQRYALNINVNREPDSEDSYNYDSLYADFDAQTKQLLNLYVYSSTTDGGKDAKRDQAKQQAAADAFIEKYGAGVTGISKKPDVNPYVDDRGSITFVYPQQVNGYNIANYGVNVTVGKNNLITSYNLTLYNGKLPQKQDVISQAAAIKTFGEKAGVQLSYQIIYRDLDKMDMLSSKMPAPSSPTQYTLVYGLPEGKQWVDAVSGELIDFSYWYTNVVQPIEYEDIAGHKYEKEIAKLAELGVLVSDNPFKPDENITQSELFSQLYNTFTQYGYRYNDVKRGSVSNTEYMSWMYTMAVNGDYVKAIDVAPDAEVTREDAIKYLLLFSKAMGIMGEYSSMYTVGYADKADITSENMAYMAMCEQLQLLPAADNKILPKQKVTRGDAAYMIYQLLNR